MSENFNFVGKQINTSNVAQVRPSESFWGDLAQKGYTGGWKAKIREQLVDHITLKLKDFDANYLQTIMKHAKTNLRKIADGCVFATFKK